MLVGTRYTRKCVLSIILFDAQRQYAKTSIALLDFLDARDRCFLARYQEETGRITNVLEEHARVRTELEKQLCEP